MPHPVVRTPAFQMSDFAGVLRVYRCGHQRIARSKVRAQALDSNNVSSEGKMSRMPPATVGVVSMLALWVLAAIGSAIGWIHLPAPTEEFTAWSELVATIAVVAFGARVLWVTPTQVQSFLARRHLGAAVPDSRPADTADPSGPG